MGIRIHKMMGYGLTDVLVGDEEDPRIDYTSPIFEYELDGKKQVVNYLAWVEENDRGWDTAQSLLNAEEKQGQRLERRAFSIQDCFQWGTVDGGLEHVLCIRPLAWRDWYRYDDMIDYVEQTESKKGQRDVVKVLRHGIYPHSSYMDKRVGDRIKGDVHSWQRVLSSIRAREEEVDVDVLDTLAGLFGMTHAEAEENIVPHVPDEVRWLSEYVGIFKDPATVLQLRPMIYTWWA